jgi:2-methylisocitrate lyase-like PEP mutase family enzyme
MTVSQNDKAARFRALHQGPRAFVIANPWDAGSRPHPRRAGLPGARDLKRRQGRRSWQA